MRPKHKRLFMLLLSVVVMSSAAFFIFANLRDNLVFFFSPTEISKIPNGQIVRIGGLVETGSVEQMPDGSITFSVTDFTSSITIKYNGILPNLFREGQGVVVKGKLKVSDNDNIFMAEEILAKHDENYMPEEVANALKKSGRWKSGN